PAREPRGMAHHVDVTVGHRVERAWIKGNRLHRQGLARGSAARKAGWPSSPRSACWEKGAVRLFTFSIFLNLALNLPPRPRDTWTDGPWGWPDGANQGLAQMIKILAAVGGAALLAGIIVLLPGMTPIDPVVAAQAYGKIESGKTDRVDIRNYGPGCT